MRVLPRVSSLGVTTFRYLLRCRSCLFLFPAADVNTPGEPGIPSEQGSYFVASVVIADRLQGGEFIIVITPEWCGNDDHMIFCLLVFDIGVGSFFRVCCWPTNSLLWFLRSRTLPRKYTEDKSTPRMPLPGHDDCRWCLLCCWNLAWSQV